ncbi:MAG: DeoR/GlpR transcriptional regulator [Oscillospiraceae bacterium]|nr:DeoR/GlpR transcriptional regulator [Oscillospiraceae bacterium]
MRIDRLNSIEKYVIKHKTASLEELASSFGVSMNTIRRDVKQLLDRGALQKVYGGVSIKTEPLGQVFQPFAQRSSRNVNEKELIGKLAASLVDDGSSLFLDAGSTTPHILPHLSEKSDITVITHSLTAMCEAAKYPNLSAIALGGLYYQHTSSYVGISTLDALEKMRINTVFIAATGVSTDHGVTNSTYLEAEVKRKVVKCGSRVVLMADHTKFDRSSPITFCDFSDLYCLVTDRMPPKEYVEVLKSNNVLLLCPGAEL